MVTRASNQTIQYTTLFYFFSAMLIYFMLTVLKTSITCVDSQGCLLEHCQKVKFKQDYNTLIEEASETADCPTYKK